MAYTTINKSTEHFNTKLYTGTGSSNALTGVGFQPDWVWFKGRNQTYHHYLFDAVRGVNKPIHSSLTNAQSTQTDTLMSFDSDGFTLGSDSNNGEMNSSGNTFSSWSWKANGAGSANTDGDINSTVSANTTSGFSIVKYTGNGSNDQTVGHGLGARPTAWFIKRLDSADDWIVYHQGLGVTQSADWYDDTYMYLNSTSAKMGSVNAGTGNPTTSVFYIGNSDKTGKNGDDYIAYVFAEKTGYSKFGSYVGNNNSDGSFIYTGFKPAFILMKSTAANENWTIYDNKRASFNPSTVRIYANLNNAESSSTDLDLLSNGFKLRTTGGNSNNGTLIYMAFAEAPLVGTNNVPCTAR